MNKKIEVLRRRNSEDEEQGSGDKKGILDVYKKLIETKQLEIENLKKRVRGKTGLVSANMRLLSKLEALFTEKLSELSEVSQNQEKLIAENKKLSVIIKDQSNEIEKLRKHFSSDQNTNLHSENKEHKFALRRVFEEQDQSNQERNKSENKDLINSE